MDFRNIRIVNLSKGFTPFSSISLTQPLEFESFTFSGGERHIKFQQCTWFNVDKVIITHRICSSADFMTLLLAKDALERMGMNRFELVMPYIPYARQDRKCVDGEAFSLDVFCDILNAQNFEKVTVLDAHSDVAPALIHRSHNLDNLEFIEKVVYDINGYGTSDELVLISPDAGSNKKCNKVFREVDGFTQLVKCDKVRDMDTGKLSGFAVFADDLKGAPCVIVDDICDGGGTFMGLAQELKKKNAGQIYLFVTHGIFSKGFDELGKHFDWIFTTDSFVDFENLNEKKLTQFKIKLKSD